VFNLEQLFKQASINAIDLHFGRLLSKLDPSQDTLALAGALCSAVSRHGDVCLRLNDLNSLFFILNIEESGQTVLQFEQIRQLSYGPAVGYPGEQKPLILDENDRLYLHRFWTMENYLASRIDNILGDTSVVCKPDMDVISRVFHEYSEDVISDLNRALQKRLTILTGGPGTGKTTVLAQLLKALKYADPALKIKLAAPTGKAAARMQESILAQTDKLQPDEFSGVEIPTEASTIHRLLGYASSGQGFKYDKSNPLNCDVLVIDEASMIGLSLMTSLLDALPAKSRLILVGDPNQLSSIEAGYILGDLRKSLTECVVHLSKTWRFSSTSGIGKLAEELLNGNSSSVLSVLRDPGEQGASLQNLPVNATQAFELNNLYKTLWQNFINADDPHAALHALSKCRILSTQTNGTWGTRKLNTFLSNLFSHSMLRSESKVKTPLMIRKNDYDLMLYNGDTGVLWDAELKTDNNVDDKVWFFDADAKLRSFSKFSLPFYELAYCSTVHRSQGAEFDHVILFLPDENSPYLRRELLYTAVTRARKSIMIFGSEQAVINSIQNSSTRQSGLVDALSTKPR
jgi:exodeoxyribonuclease V alpha subunit